MTTSSLDPDADVSRPDGSRSDEAELASPTTSGGLPVAGAIETSDRIASHLHPEGTFDVSAHPVPTGREEVWRFTPIKRLRGLHDDAPFADGAVTVTSDVPEGASLRVVGTDDPVLGSSGYKPTDRVSARAWEAASGATVIEIEESADLGAPVVLTHRGTGSETAEGRIVHVRAGRFSRATVVLRYEGTATLADNVEIVAEDGAQLTVVSVQDWDREAVHHGTQHTHVGRDAHVKHIVVTFGGDLVRLNVSLDYDSTGGEAEMFGLYFADDGQHLEHRLFVDHNRPKGISNVDYRGALQGESAHTVWVGDVLIRTSAEGIETYENNKNLVLTDGARADSVPNLEIETGEIAGAGHASTTGKFDDEHLFYLCSRGIAEEEARRLVIHGFFHDIIRRIGVPAVEESLLETLESELSAHVGTPSTLTTTTQES